MGIPAWYQAPLVAALSPAQRAALEAIAGTRSLEAQQVLFHEEDPCTGFYVLVEGAIQLTRAGDAPSAHPTLAVVLPVASFAEAAMFGDEAFPATATALKPSRVVHFPKARFLGALREDPALAMAVIHAQAVWLRRLTRKVQELSGTPSGDRLRAWLRQQLPAPGSTLQLQMPKKALAAQRGMTPETLSRSLRSLQEEGALEVTGRLLRRRGPL